MSNKNYKAKQWKILHMTLFERSFFSGFSMSWLNILLVVWAILVPSKTPRRLRFYHSPHKTNVEYSHLIYALNKYGFPKAKNTKSHMCTAFHNIRNDKIFSNGMAECEYQNKLSSNTLLNIEWLASVLFRFRYAILLCTNIAMLSKTAA